VSGAAVEPQLCHLAKSSCHFVAPQLQTPYACAYAERQQRRFFYEDIHYRLDLTIALCSYARDEWTCGFVLLLLLPAVRLVAARLGWQVVPAGSADSQWDLFWTDTSISQERLLRLAPTQVRSQQQR
jgi:hypothetical protein